MSVPVAPDGSEADPSPGPGPGITTDPGPDRDSDSPVEPDFGTDAGTAARADPGPGPAAVPRRHRVAFWGCVVLALGLLGGGAYLAVTAYLAETAPESVAADYLAAVADGDAARALAYGDRPEASTDLITAEVLELQNEIAPMSGIEVIDVDQSAAAATVEVRYELGFDSGPMTVEDTLELVRTDRTWELAQTAVSLNIRMRNASSRATLGGALVPGGTVLLFPGALPVDFDTDNLELVEESRVVRFANSAVEEEAQLSAAGQEAIGAALDAALAACLAGTAEMQTLCPLPTDSRAVPGSLRGTVTAPASTLATYVVQTNPEGRVFITADIEVAGEYAQLDFNNQRVPVAGPHTVRVRASSYATSPELIVWSAP